MILRLSQKLAKKIKAGPLPAMPLDDNPYADWSCHLFTAKRTQYIIIANTASLYSCLMYGRGITREHVFIERTLGALREFMEADGQVLTYQRFIESARSRVSFAKAMNRSVTGSINEFVFYAKTWLSDIDFSPHEISFKLNGLLMSALGGDKSGPYGKPREAFLALADRLGSSADRNEG